MTVSFKDVTKKFADGTIALDTLNLEFNLGEFIVLLGPSGSGKTTACRLLAGLEEPSSGQIEVNGNNITNLPPRMRDMGMVFQNYALYSHKNIYENIAYPLRIRKKSKAEIDKRVNNVAELLQIKKYLHRKPGQLSGGQAQRVAVARALVWEPSICLMDEPLSNLDALLRLHMRTELNRLHRSLKKTFVFVTHDQEEAMTLATRIAILKDGKLAQFDEPRTIYREPANRFVAEFMGRPAMNTFDGVVVNGIFESRDLRFPVDAADGPITVGIRPEQIQLGANEGAHPISLPLDVRELIEPDMLLIFKVNDTQLTVRTSHDDNDFTAGQTTTLSFPKHALHYFDASTGNRIR